MEVNADVFQPQPAPSYSKLSPEMIARIKQLRTQYSTAHVASLLGISMSSVARHQHPERHRRKRTGRPTTLTSMEEKLLVAIICSVNDFYCTVSSKTVRRWV
jgi:hypothetical protein